jgi:phosphoribosyl-dephospho-CoA transferase
MFARHDLVWLTESGWQRAHDAATPQEKGIIEMWQQRDWPGIVRRADADCPPQQLSFGIAIPPRASDGYKIRVALRTPQSEVRKLLPPLRLLEVLDALPRAWRVPLTRLDCNALRLGVELHVFGSVALQALTGQIYLTPTSDIDLLARPRSTAQLHQVLGLLSACTRSIPLDGEIVFPQGQAVAWKELASALGAANGTRVLVKHMHGVQLAKPSALLATMKEDVCLS